MSNFCYRNENWRNLINPNPSLNPKPNPNLDKKIYQGNYLRGINRGNCPESGFSGHSKQHKFFSFKQGYKMHILNRNIFPEKHVKLVDKTFRDQNVECVPHKIFILVSIY